MFERGGIIKIDRLIGIITLLLQNDKITAPYLAEKFEVSRRTISRDIDDLCKAGIPVATTQGYDGGISITQGYKIDKTLFTADELQAIFTGLRGLDSVSKTQHSKSLADKLNVGNNSVFCSTDNIVIDLSSHYKNSLTHKIEMIKSAINNQTIITFRYYYTKGEEQRSIEPYFLVFKWSDWYIFGYCTKKKDFRLFKLNRLWDLYCTTQYYEKRDIPQSKINFDHYFSDEIQLVATFDQSVKYRLIEEYGVECFTDTEDGRLLFNKGFTNHENLLSWVLSFGSNVEVIEPQELRLQIKKQAENILKKY